MVENFVTSIDTNAFIGAMLFVLAGGMMVALSFLSGRYRMSNQRDEFHHELAKSTTATQAELRNAQVTHAKEVAQLRVDFELRIAETDKRHADERLSDIQARRDERLADAQLIGKLNHQVEQLEKADLHNQKTIENQAEVILDMQKKLDNAAIALQENEGLRVQVANLQMRLEELSKQVEKMIQDIATLKQERDAAIAEAEKLKDENEHLRTENRQLKAQIERTKTDQMTDNRNQAD